MSRVLMPHQRDCLVWALPEATPAIYMQMRLGKSLVAQRWSDPRARKLLVCPLSVIPTWERECALEGETCFTLTGTRERRLKALHDSGGAAGRYLINPEGLVGRGDEGLASEFAKLRWDEVTIDESTCIRNPKAKITKVALRELADAPRRCLLSGLPNPEGPEDFVTQMLFLRGSFMGCDNYWKWRQEFMMPSGHGWVPKSSTLGPLRAEVHRFAFFLTRREAGLKDEKVRTTRWVTLPPKVMTAMRTAETDFEVAGRVTANKLETNTWLTQLAGGRFPDPDLWHDVKFAEVRDLVTGELRDQKLIVWARYTVEQEALAGHLQKVGVRTVLVNGEVDQSDRGPLIDSWRARNGPRVLIAQPRCLSRGVDLSEAEVAIFMSNYWDYEIRSQAEDRIVHPKKERPALIIDVVARGTVDEDVADALNEKGLDSKTFNRRIMERMRQRRAAA